MTVTIQTAISRVNELKPNAYTDAEKIAWLSELDGRIDNEILSSHDGHSEEDAFQGYTDLTSTSTKLIAPAPYDAMYLYWLFAKIDFMNMETTRFNNSILLFNTAWSDYANYVNRTRLPKQDHRLARA